MFATSYRKLSRGCCVPTTCSVVQFSFQSAAETSKFATTSPLYYPRSDALEYGRTYQEMIEGCRHVLL